jgi:hypothetical protein
VVENARPSDEKYEADVVENVPSPALRHVPFTAKQPAVMFTPFAIVVEPVFETVKSVVVAVPEDDAIANGVLLNPVAVDDAKTVRSANGDDVPPTPTLPRTLPSKILPLDPPPRLFAPAFKMTFPPEATPKTHNLF